MLCSYGYRADKGRKLLNCLEHLLKIHQTVKAQWERLITLLSISGNTEWETNDQRPSWVDDGISCTRKLYLLDFRRSPLTPPRINISAQSEKKKTAWFANILCVLKKIKPQHQQITRSFWVRSSKTEVDMRDFLLWTFVYQNTNKPIWFIIHEAESDINFRGENQWNEWKNVVKKH